MEKKKLDICICIKNRQNIIPDLIDQLMNQTETNFNILLCDDLSIDNTMNILLEYQDKYPGIVYAWQTEEEGYINVHNFILSKTISDYVCIIDSDDVIDENKIKSQITFLDNNQDIDVVSSSVIFPDKKLLANTFIQCNHNDIENLINNGVPMTTICFFQSCMFRRKCLEIFKNGKYFYDEYVGGRCGEGFLYTLFYLGYKFSSITSTIYLYRYQIFPDALSNNIIPLFAENIDKLPIEDKKTKILELFKKYNS